MSRVRTNIEIEDTYLRAIMDRYGVRTRTAAVDRALRHLAGQPMTREEALAMQAANAIAELPPDVPPRASAPSGVVHDDLGWFVGSAPGGEDELDAAQAWLDGLPSEPA